ncbi:hypothetical protein ABIF07_006287 [Bradyrhizobium elkanii]|uniref:OpgC family protein n=1 Tax=Bradyrhizobium elkanii TaxID=29448 RepID=UPI002167D676|nr:OpgC domain-containing protein [Bradyrhizobium elkanii]MCS3686692.1 hypothetical protein [Bradyrhizobium elkanii]
MTAVRSRSETVAFRYPFRIASIERLLPAGSYEVITDEELMEGSSVPSFRCVATRIMVLAPLRSPVVEMIPISSTDLSTARDTMRWPPASDVPVDIDKHRDMPSPNFQRTLAEIESKALRGQQLQLESELLAIPARSLVSALPEPKGSGRDLRIDVCRGIALWCIFLDHVPNNIGNWLTLRNYGFSDTAEVFMFLSGVTCALAYGKASRCDGWASVVSRTLWRSWDIYAAFLLLTIACAIMVHLAGGGRIADQSNTRILLEHSGAALAYAAILQYHPVNSDVLPLFVIYHLIFAPLLWLMLRTPNVMLGASLLLYALVHAFGWSVPAWPNNVWFFNPLAWQLLVVLGAWCVIAGKTFWPWVTSRTALAIAILYLGFSLTIALSLNIRSPAPQMLAELVYLLDKSNLAPLRLLHFVALAILVAWAVPRDWRWLTAPAMRGAIRCGENSLAIYCLGVVLALAAHIVLIDISHNLAMQITLSIAGILVMIAAATLLGLIRIRPGRKPQGPAEFAWRNLDSRE